ncbi:sugar/nucleoside kinase (ribokinase family) [Agromyces terreus]|uniref:Sugar/nucleoside kinase (Ribokinase family) n=1 Tax=Agromyces terreus TaxID=424795 RepID=A0A9X2KC32_9MICO|nr:PfkB family carbohydrate kinase [Agromyces terreus]MCP2371229.1 sugar/nucleoside kinase (ribokinase family) [Agromyces terreus]
MPSPVDGVGADARQGRPTGRLAVAGDLVEDIVVWASEPVHRATDTAARVFRARGGSAANVAALAAGFVETRFIGRVGADAAGDALVAALSSSGVEVRTQRGGRTGTVVLLIDVDGERTMYPDRGASAELEGVDAAWLDEVGLLHLPAYGFEREPMRGELARLAAAARAAGAEVSIDASSTGLLEGLGVGFALDLVRGIRPDVLFANEDEAALLGLTDGGRVAASVAPTVVVKHGALPTDVIVDGRLSARVDVEPVTGIRDLTGAGDAFAAGFLAARLHGADAETACLAGHRSAASVLGSPGAHAAASSDSSM